MAETDSGTAYNDLLERAKKRRPPQSARLEIRIKALETSRSGQHAEIDLMGRTLYNEFVREMKTRPGWSRRAGWGTNELLPLTSHKTTPSRANRIFGDYADSLSRPSEFNDIFDSHFSR